VTRYPASSWTPSIPGPELASRWLHTDNAQALHDELAAAGVPIVVPPADGPFGRMFTFTDPDGYAVTIHDQP
jgi:predicted enzyme related to lactoylglutathione lyase